MEYELVTSNYNFELNKEVAKRLGYGWILYGFPFAVQQTPDENGDEQALFCQAMIGADTPFALKG